MYAELFLVPCVSFLSVAQDVCPRGSTAAQVPACLKSRTWSGLLSKTDTVKLTKNNGGFLCEGDESEIFTVNQNLKENETKQSYRCVKQISASAGPYIQ